MHRLSHRLHSSTLDYLGLVPALQKLVAEFSERHDIAITFAHASVPPSLPSEVALCLFRIAEESLTNIAKHSQARSANVQVTGAPDGIHLTSRGCRQRLRYDDARAAGPVSALSACRSGYALFAGRFMSTPLHRGARESTPGCRRVMLTSASQRDANCKPAMKRPRILLADDHKLMAEALQHLLQADFDVVGTVSDGRALIKAAAELKPELVVVDIGMPLLNGLDAADQLKALHPEIKIIFLTQNREPRFAVEAFRRKASGYLLKDSAASELTTAIREALQGRTYVSPLIAKGMLTHALNREPGDPGCAS